jgi:hypothetical protein
MKKINNVNNLENILNQEYTIISQNFYD